MSLLTPLMPLLPRLPGLSLLRRMRHGLTLGVRALAIDGAGRVLLVRHTYTPGWHLPGGGVDVGESAEAAARRELQEEAQVRATGPLLLHGVFFNIHAGGRDHVVCYRVPAFEIGPEPAPSLEIAAVAWWPLDALPADTTPATRRRLQEVASGTSPGDCW